jgi:peptidoglycan/LPS O-acetylase OafA/YrhL
MTRDNNFDALRLALAVLVIYSHSFPLGADDQVHEPLFMLTRGQLTFGGFAVDCFFIISGYLITQSWERSASLWQYMRKRVARIYPGFIVAMVACWLLVITSNNAPLTFDWSGVLSFVCRVATLREPAWPQVFVGNPTPLTVNGSTWTILYEFICYVGLAALGLVGMLRKGRFVVFTFALSIVAQSVLELSFLHVEGSKVLLIVLRLARFVPLYLAGVVHYLYRDKLPINGRFAVISLLGCAVTARIPGAFSIAFPVFGAYLVFYLAFSRHIRVYKFAKYGDFSYGTYLYAFPIQQLLMHWHGAATTPMRLFASATPLALLIGATSWYCVERPFLRPKGKRISQQARDRHATPELPFSRSVPQEGAGQRPV